MFFVTYDNAAGVGTNSSFLPLAVDVVAGPNTKLPTTLLDDNLGTNGRNGLVCIVGRGVVVGCTVGGGTTTISGCCCC